MTSPRKVDSPRRIALLALGVLTMIACTKQTESLVLVSLTANPADAALVSAQLTVGSEVKTFQLTGGLSANVPTTFGVYIPSGTATQSVPVSVTASDGTACGGYRGTGSAPLMVGPNETASISIVLQPGITCPADGSAGAPGSGGGGAGAGGGGGSGGTGTGGGGGQKIAPPTLTHCTQYIHNADPTAACVTGNANTDVEITDIAFSADGKLLYSAGNDSRVKIWTWDGANLAAEGHELDTMGGFACLAVSPDNSLVAAGSQSGGLAVWNVGGSWSLAANLMGNVGNVNGVAFSPDGTILYSVDASSSLNIFNQASLYPSGGAVLRATATPYTLSSGPAAADGSYWLAIGYSDGNASLLNIDPTGLAGSEMPFTVSTAVSGVYTARISPDGMMVEAGTADGAFGIWTVPTLGSSRTPQIAVGTDSVFGGAFDPTSTYLAIAGGLSVGTRKIGIWTVSTGVSRANVPTSLYTQRPTAVAFSPDGTALAVGEHNCGLLLVCVN